MRQNDRQFRRTVLRDIAFEYRRLASLRESGGIQGLIRAGIYQCENDREYACVLNLVDDLKPEIELGENWRPKSGKHVEFFTRLKSEGKAPTSTPQMLTDEALNVLGGKVLCHSKDRDEVYRRAVSLRPKRSAVVYTGEIPEGTAVVL